MSTLLENLESAPPLGDGDFVQNIMAEMNGGGTIQAPPAISGQAPMMNSPGPNTIAPRVMDNGPATAHIIGNSHPTPGDFARVMAGGGGSGAPSAPGPGPVASESWAGGGAAYQAGPAMPMPSYVPAKKSWLARTVEQFRVPMLVAILVFVFSLPIVNFLFAHYLPSMVKPTGELTVVGLVIKSFAAAAAFWFLQQVIVPLLSL